jgi:hypothetical protein
LLFWSVSLVPPSLFWSVVFRLLALLPGRVSEAPAQGEVFPKHALAEQHDRSGQNDQPE